MSEPSTLFVSDFDAGEPEYLFGELDYRQIFEVIIDHTFPRMQPMLFQPLSLYAGNSKEYICLVKDRDLVPIDLTGATGYMTFKKTKDDPILFQKNGVPSVPTQGEIRFNLVQADTLSLPARQYAYDVTIVTASGKTYTVLTGLLTLKQPVNQ